MPLPGFLAAGVAKVALGWLRKNWLTVVIVLVFVVPWVGWGCSRADAKAAKVDLETAQKAVGELERQVEVYKANEVTADELRAEVQVCLDDVAAAKDREDAWRVAYEAERRRPLPTVPTPAPVTAIDCEQAVADFGERLLVTFGGLEVPP